MTYLRRVVVVLLLAIWTFPATGLARSETQGSQAQSGRSAPVDVNGRGGVAATSSETQQYSQREKQSQNLEQFDGGDALYISGGVVTLLLVILILILVL